MSYNADKKLNDLSTKLNAVEFPDMNFNSDLNESTTEDIKWECPKCKKIETTIDLYNENICSACFSSMEKVNSNLKVNEQSAYSVIAQGISDKGIADRVAREKKGRVIADEKDAKKFMVISVSESKVNEGKKAYEEQEEWEDIIDIAKKLRKQGKSFDDIVNVLYDNRINRAWLNKWYPGNEFDLRQELEHILNIEESQVNEPPAMLASLAKEAGVSMKDAERYWEETKKQRMKDTGKGEKSFTDRDWQYVTGVTKKRMGLKTEPLRDSKVNEVETKDKDLEELKKKDKRTITIAKDGDKYKWEIKEDDVIRSGFSNYESAKQDLMGYLQGMSESKKVSEMALTSTSKKYIVRGQAYSRKTGEKVGEERDEVIDIGKNELFAGRVHSLGDIEKYYERFWNVLDPHSKEIVKVISIRPVSESQVNEEAEIIGEVDSIVRENESKKINEIESKDKDLNEGFNSKVLAVSIVDRIEKKLGDADEIRDDYVRSSVKSYLHGVLDRIENMLYDEVIILLKNRGKVIEESKVNEQIEKIEITDELVDQVAKDLGVDFEKVNREEFKKGLEVEQEHIEVLGGEMDKVGRVVLDHLNEFPDYYTRLIAMEQQAKQTEECKENKVSEAFSRKHYEKSAQGLSKIKDVDDRNAMMNVLIAMFKEDNPRFDEGRFRTTVKESVEAKEKKIIFEYLNKQSKKRDLTEKELRFITKYLKENKIN